MTLSTKTFSNTDGKMVNLMAILHLMVGLPCSGKTTLARKLENKYEALRLTPDDWHIRLGHEFGLGMTEGEEEVHNQRHDAVESLMWDVAERVLILGVDVVLDFGFWSKNERDEFRDRANKIGAEFKIHYTDVSENELIERLRIRNIKRPEGTFAIPEEKLKEWTRLFEPPTSEELDS